MNAPQPQVNVFDLHARHLHACFEMGDRGRVRRIGGAQILRRLMLYPRSACENRSPYLQDPLHPSIEDLWNPERECFEFDRAMPLWKILEGLRVPEDEFQGGHEGSREAQRKRERALRDYFHACEAGRDYCEDCEQYILTIPDDEDARMQERMLQAFHQPRSRTQLLWRSVAACLGFEDRLKAMGARENQRVAVVDWEFDRVLVSILTLKRKDGFLVPARRSYLNTSSGAINRENYPIGEAYEFKSLFNDEEDAFIDNTFYTGNRRPVTWDPVLHAWHREPEETLRSGYLSLSAIRDVDFCIHIGRYTRARAEKSLYGFDTTRCLYETKEEMQLARGAALYAARLREGLPTYFDECAGLSIVVENVSKECIEAVSLIKGSQLCEGGKELVGDPYRGLSIRAQEDFVEFYLAMGEVTPNSRNLRKLKQQFELSSPKQQPIVLFPSMIPGQGLAKVKVEAHPLFREPIVLNLLENMVWVRDETLQTLNARIRRSFPADTPEVVASDSKWERIEAKVSRYVRGTLEPDGSWFAKASSLRARAEGIEKLSKSNVFGTEEGQEVPSLPAPSFLERLWERLAKDAERGDYVTTAVRLIAWTYQRNNPCFRPIVQSTLKLIEETAQFCLALQSPYFTLCGNLVCQDQDIERFLRAFCIHVRKQLDFVGSTEECGRVTNWFRALGSMLQLNNDALRLPHLKPDEAEGLCLTVAECCVDVLSNYLIFRRKRALYYNYILYALFYLLRRRKYQPSFLKPSLSRSGDSCYRKLVRCLNKLIAERDNAAQATASVLKQFLESTGSLEGMVQCFSDTLSD